MLERGERVGGVWNQNTYPGAACDVPSHLYSYSFARNPRWGRRFAAQPEIQRYVEDVARQHGVLDRVRLGTDVTLRRLGRGLRALAPRDRRRRRRGRRARLRLRTADTARRSRTSRASIGSPDRRSTRPSGATTSTCAGCAWACSGSGASAIQFVPAIQPLVRSMTVVQRTPPWILPKPDRAYRRVRHRDVRAPAGRAARRALRLVGFPGGGHRGVHRARRGDAAARRDLARAPAPPGPRPGAAPPAHPDLQDGLQARPDQQRLVSGAHGAERRRRHRRASTARPRPASCCATAARSSST